MIRRRILFGVLLVALFGFGWGVGRGRATGGVYENLNVFLDVLHAVRTSYVDPVDSRPLIEGGLRGMLRVLDPYSQYLDEHEYASLQSSLEEEFDGIGALVDLHEGYPVVVAPIENSPAWEAGLLPGDVLIKIDGHPTFGLGLPEVAAKLRGAAGSAVKLSVIRRGEGDDHEVVIQRRRIESRSVPYAFMAAPGLGYVRLSRFSERAGDELAAALDTLRAGGARALVLDLRGNPGGLVEQAVAVTQAFVPEGSLVVYTRGRAANTSRRWSAGKARSAVGWPVAVLVDGGSASASEIVAGALQDLDRALVVGETSFGKGTVQDVYPLRSQHGALKLTTAYYYTASGRSLQRRRASEDALVDDGGDGADADSAAADSAAARPEFRTAAGRRVYGGGGVTPDLVVAPDSLPALARRLETGRVAFRFASRWVAAHPGASTDDANGPEVWTAFREFAATEGVAATSAAFESERAAIGPQLRRELARRTAGAVAAARVALAGDGAFQRAADVLRRARTAREVFALAGAAQGAAPAPAAPAPARRVH